MISNGTSRSIELPGSGQLVVGRGPEAELQVDDDSVSRRHAMFATRDGELTVADLDSHNGTRVNAEPIAGMHRLAEGDVVQIGDVILVVHGQLRRPHHELLDRARLQARLEHELDRAAAFDRELGVVAIACERAPVADIIGDLGGCFGIVTPELDREAVAALAGEYVAAGGSGARAGYAICPEDGADATALVVAARDACSHAAAGTVVAAGDRVTRLELGGQSTIVADPAMARLFELVRQVARTELAVLVRGETGAGKEHVARALHAFSPRAGRPLVTLNCAAVQDTLVESELFGYDKGAFTGASAAKPGLLETAHGGTILLDEVGELSPAMQAKLLRALDAKRITRVGSVVEREIDIRVIAATNRDLERETAAGRFRRDLYYRLGGATIALPPLRDRPRELAVLARLFLDELERRAGTRAPRISTGALRALTRHHWPGNIRELRNAIELAAATAGDDGVIATWHVPGDGTPGPALAAAGSSRFRPIADEVRDLERRRMREAIAAANGVLKHAAQLIHMPLRTFHFKAKHYGLMRTDSDS
ncbi:MAG TPA: sigma 54-interacting transcriptional regulator [Kofleriaceae bacterium]|nr:sigma 54-interacting transcriptional regulator [Kofleriaceae bacterium]